MSVEGDRWAVEDGFETTKNELGLDHNQTRSCHGGHCHVLHVMLAFATMSVVGSRAHTAPKSRLAAFGQSIVLDPLVECASGEGRLAE